MNKFADAFIRYLYPKRRKCLLCDIEADGYICDLCSFTIPFIHERRCLICGKGLKDEYAENICPYCKACKYSFHSAYSSFYYSGSGKELIHKLKYEGKKEGAKILAEYMAEIIYEESLKADFIVPVPIHNKKLELRGFNQAFVIGEYLSTLISIPILDCLIRIRNTKDQYNLSKYQRRLNVIDAFSVNLNYNVINKVILLIDDVFTTGSTVDECSKILMASGAKCVYVVTAATGTNT